MTLLSKLSDKFRDVVFKRYWLGMNSSEIARVMSVPASTVRWRLHTALKLLKTYQQNQSTGIQVFSDSVLL
jgi:RNA polymerase sigma-70 factor (ECF subfamily)